MLIAALFTIGIVSGSYADKLGDGALYDVFNSGGAVLEGNGYKILNSIAEPVSGKIGDSTSSIWWGLFGLFGGVVEKPDVPYGTVPLYISRDGNDVKITWEAIYVNPTIVAVSGGGYGLYDKNPTSDWLTVLQAGAVKTLPPLLGPMILSDATTLKHTQQVTGGTSECYYKGFQAAIGDPKVAINPNTNTLIFPTAVAVGKVNVLVERNDTQISFFSFSVPLVSQNKVDDFDAIFPIYKFVKVTDPNGNLLLGDQIREWDGSSWKSAVNYNDTSWNITSDMGQKAKHTFGRGYVLRLQPVSNSPLKAFNITVVGSVLATTYQSDLAYGGTKSVGSLGGVKFSAFGNPFPKKASFNNAYVLNTTSLNGGTYGQNLLLADQVRAWDHTTGSWKSIYYDGSNWKKTDDNSVAFDYQMKKGYVFRRADGDTKGGFVWKYQMP